MFSNKPSSFAANVAQLNSQHQHLYMTPVRTPTSFVSSSDIGNNVNTLSWRNQLATNMPSNSLTGVIGSGLLLSGKDANNTEQRTVRNLATSTTISHVNSLQCFKNSSSFDQENAAKDRCEHQAAMYHRSQCDHCGEKFCDDCEIRHKERIKKEIFKMAVAFLNQDFVVDQENVTKRALEVRDYLGKYVEEIRRDVESEISNTQIKFARALQVFVDKLKSDADAMIEEACRLRDEEVLNLMAIAQESVLRQGDKSKIAEIVNSLQRGEICYITLKAMAELHRNTVRYYGINCAIDALSSCSEFYAGKGIVFNRHPGFAPMLDRCLDSLQSAHLGSVKFLSPISKIRSMLSGQNDESSPFKPVLNCSPPTAPGDTVNKNRYHFVGKAFYDRLEIVGVVSGRDADSWEIRKPFGLVWLTNTEYLAIVHRPKRITLITVRGEVKATYKFSDPDCNQAAGGLNFHGNLAADDEWKIYFIDEPGLRIFCLDVRANIFKSYSSEVVTPRVFTRLHSSGGSRSAISLSQMSNSSGDVAFCNKMKFHGLAVGLARRELYTEAGDSIVGFSLADGSPRFRCLLEHAHQFSSHVLGVIDRPNSISYLIYSTSHGNVLHKKAFLSNGLLEEGSSVIAYQGTDANCVSEVRGVANDPAGNLLLADSKNRCIKVFSENFQVISSFGYGDALSFNPSAVAVAYRENGQPVVVVTEFSSHRILLFSTSG